MNILITGGTGFMGRHLVSSLSPSNNIIVINTTNCDLTEKTNLLSSEFTNQKFDIIYHLAAWTKAGDFCLYHKGEQWIYNQQINTNILWYWTKFQKSAVLITMGSGCAYPPMYELVEKNYMIDEPDVDLYTYAMTKRMLYEGVRSLHHQYGMDYIYLIPSTLYGPRFELSDSHFIFELIIKIINGKKYGSPVVLWGDGYQIRELIYIDDVICLIDIANKKCKNQLLNLGSGIGYTIRQYAKIICDIVGYSPDKIIYDTSKFRGVSKKVFNVDKIKKLYEFKFTPIKIGLEKTINYYINQL